MSNPKPYAIFGELLTQGIKNLASKRHQSVGPVQQQLANELGFSSGAIFGWRRGERLPDPGIIAELARLFVRGWNADEVWIEHFLRTGDYGASQTIKILKQELFGDQARRVNINDQIYQLTDKSQFSTATGLSSSTSQTPPPFMTPSLPPQGVFGRDDVITNIFNLLALNDKNVTNVPPIALHGMGGIGKTTLAITLGRLDMIPILFPDGVLWTALGPNPTIRLLLDAWGKALEVDLLPERDENACRDRLRAILHHRRMLLIIDDVWEVSHGNYFTVAGPHCRTLLTTRETPAAYTLATRARSLRVDVLSPEAALALLRRLSPEAVAADEANAKGLCERLEYLPLALTLAGQFLATETDVPSRMQRLVSELIERRESRLQLLQTEGRPGLSENEAVSLQAILGMSVDRLSKIDQERFAMLAVFGGEPLTWEINATAYVWDCSVEEAETSLSHLIQRGLVAPRDNRYWMHALLADYAAEMIDEMGL